MKEKKQRFSNIIILAILILILIFYIQSAKSKDNTHANQFLEIKNGEFILDNKPFIMKGFNYFPRNYHKSSMTTWDWKEVDEELALGKTLGANIVRTFIDYGFSTDSLGKGDYNDGINDEWEVKTYYKPTNQYISAIDNFLAIADTHKLKVIFSLFDYMPGWAFIEQREQYIGLAKVYLDFLIGHFKNDSRIIVWDILNEGDLLPEKYKEYHITLPMVLNFYNDIYDTLRKIDPNHKITAVFGNIDSVYKSESFVDFISFQFPDTDQAFYGEVIRQLKSTIKNKEMPIVSAEFSHSTQWIKGASEREHTIRMTNYYDHCLNVESSRLNGALFWTLTDFNQPKTALTRLTIPIPHDERYELYKGILDSTLEKKTSFELIKKYFTNQYGAEDRLDFKYSKIKKPSDLDSSDTRHFAVIFHDKIEFLAKDGSVIDFISFSDTNMTKQLPGKGWYLLEDWNRWHGYWGQKAGNLDSVSSMYITPPDSTCFIKMKLEGDSSNTEVIISFGGFPLDTINLIKEPIEHAIAFNFPPKIIHISNFSFENDKKYQINLDTCVTDRNNLLQEMSWDIFPEKPQLKWELNNHEITFSAPDWNDSTDVKFIVKDPKGAFNSITVKAFVMLPTATEMKENSIPQNFFLKQNYPNPFNPITTINFGIPRITEITISIYNLKGQFIAELFKGKAIPGYHSITWNAKDHPSGLYFIKFQAGDFVQTQKCMLIK